MKLGATTLATYSNLNKAAGYVQRSFNVAAFAGQTATLTFTGTEDSSLQTSFVARRHGAERELAITRQGRAISFAPALTSVALAERLWSGRRVSPARPRLFLSYGHRDATELALRLRSDLEAAGYSVWQDEQSHPGRQRLD